MGAECSSCPMGGGDDLIPERVTALMPDTGKMARKGADWLMNLESVQAWTGAAFDSLANGKKFIKTNQIIESIHGDGEGHLFDGLSEYLDEDTVAAFKDLWSDFNADDWEEWVLGKGICLVTKKGTNKISKPDFHYIITNLIQLAIHGAAGTLAAKLTTQASNMAVAATMEYFLYDARVDEMSSSIFKQMAVDGEIIPTDQLGEYEKNMIDYLNTFEYMPSSLIQALDSQIGEAIKDCEENWLNGRELDEEVFKKLSRRLLRVIIAKLKNVALDDDDEEDADDALED